MRSHAEAQRRRGREAITVSSFASLRPCLRLLAVKMLFEQRVAGKCNELQEKNHWDSVMNGIGSEEAPMTSVIFNQMRVMEIPHRIAPSTRVLDQFVHDLRNRA